MASFVGENNVLPGRVVSLENGFGRVHTPANSFMARLGPGIGVGDAAKLYVRPEDARIVPVADSADALAVRVDDVAFEGSHINVHAQDGAAVATGSRSATSRAHRCRRSPPPST